MTRAALLVLLSLALPGWLEAQVSVLAVRGLGFPGQSVSARTRALGGASGVFDPVSALNPAAVAGFRRPTAMALAGTSLRNYEIAGLRADGLRSTRFPLFLAGGRISRRFAFAVSLGSYLERTFDVTAEDTLMLRGQPVAVDDRIVSDGGVADIRGALAWSPSSRVSLGVAAHVIGGSTKLQIRRVFDDQAFRSFEQDGKASFQGYGASAGAAVRVLPGLDLAAAVRFDGTLETDVDSIEAGDADLPLSVAAGAQVTLMPALRVFLSGQWRSWSDAAGDVSAGTVAFDTWEFGAGVELGGAVSGESAVPLRLGFRYAQLPFAPNSDQPREIALAIGTGIAFAATRGLLDVALERVMRDGSGVRERVWQISVGMTVRP